MTKNVNRSLGLDALVDEFETAQLAQLVVNRPSALPYRLQQAQREFPADHRGNLEKSLSLLRQSVDPRHHDIMDRVRHHQVRSQVPRFSCVQCQLFQKKRVAIGLGNNFLGYQVDQMLCPEHRADHLHAVVPGQRLQGGLSRIRLVYPRGLVTGPVGRK